MAYWVRMLARTQGGRREQPLQVVLWSWARVYSMAALLLSRFLVHSFHFFYVYECFYLNMCLCIMCLPGAAVTDSRGSHVGARS